MSTRRPLSRVASVTGKRAGPEGADWGAAVPTARRSTTTTTESEASRDGRMGLMVAPRPIPPAARLRCVGEPPGLHEDRPQHRAREPSREGVLLARVEGAEQDHSVARHGGPRPVPEARQRPRHPERPRAPRAEVGVPADLAERDD